VIFGCFKLEFTKFSCHVASFTEFITKDNVCSYTDFERQCVCQRQERRPCSVLGPVPIWAAWQARFILWNVKCEEVLSLQNKKNKIKKRKD